MNDRDSRFDDMLDESHGTVTIAGYEYTTSDALYRLDPIAYRVGLSDFRDGLCSEGEHGDTDTDDALGRCYWCGTPRAEIESGE